jgi:two-component system LytT family response regulator
MSSERRVLIADDEPAARRGVRQLLASHPAFVVAGESRNGTETARALDELRPDVVFLDVQMPGLDGFDVIRRRTPERMPLVVFLTAYEEHALAAFDADAVDYLVKPVSQARFDAAIRRVKRRLDGAAAAMEPRLIVTTPRGATMVPVREIEWIEAADNYVRLWTRGRSYLLREALDGLEARLAAHGFARAHRRALVRMAAVRTLTATADGGVVAVLESGAGILVSRRRRAAFTRAMTRS